VIYTHSLPANLAVVWSGFFNFLGVLLSTGAVAFGIVSLLPVELILQVGSQAGFAMVFAMLIAPIIWNLGTWWLGLPASSSHRLIGSIIGVGVANALLRGRNGTSGVDWGEATDIGYALLLPPIVGFVCAALLLLAFKYLINKPELFKRAKGQFAGRPLGFAVCLSSPARACPSRMARTTARRAWASSVSSQRSYVRPRSIF